jgi:signal transduction histidine kinase
LLPIMPQKPMSHFHKDSFIFLIMCLVLLPFHDVSAMQSRRKGADSHGHLASKHQPRIDSLLELSRKTPNARLSVEYADHAVRLADSLHLEISWAHAMHQSGIAWKNFGNLERSLHRLSGAEEIFRKHNLPLERHRVLRSLGETYRAGIEYDLSMRSLKEALAWFREQEEDQELAKTYNRLAATMIEVFYNHPEFKLIDPVQTEISPERFREELYEHELLLLYLEKIWLYIDSASYYADRIGSEELEISNKNIEISLKVFLFEFEDALYEYSQLIDRLQGGDYQSELILIQINQARLLGNKRLNQRERAIKLALQALALASETDIHIYQFLANDLLHENYYALGNYRKAYEHMIVIKALHEQFQGEAMRMNAATHEYDYQLRLREHELQSRKRQTRLILGSGVLLVIISLVFILILYRKNHRLRSLFGMVREQNQVISEQNRELTSLNAEKDRLFSIIAHDLRMPFTTISGFSEIIQEGDAFTKEELRHYASLIHTTAARTLQLLENLLHWARVQVGGITYQPGFHQLHQLTEVGITPLLILAETKGIRVVNRINEESRLWCDEKMLVSVIRNLVSNGIKFSHPGGEVSVTSEVDGDMLSIHVADTGIGIPPDTMGKLFHLDSGFTTSGTHDEQGTGYGLVLAKALITKHGGNIRATSVEGEGSRFTVTIPVKKEHQ